MMLQIAGALCAIALGTPEPAAAESTVIFADAIYTSNGDVIENGAVTIVDGKISAITPGKTPGDDDVHVGAITAGMIDLSARVVRGLDTVEQTNEVTPQMRVEHAIDWFDAEWGRQRKSGVTTVLLSPQDQNVIGGLSVAVKTAGSPELEERAVKRDACLRGAMGQQPSSGNHSAWGRPTDFFSRRPTTRMGVEWEWRKAFFDAAQARAAGTEATPDAQGLLDVLDGKRPLFIQAWATQDIRTAVFFKEEMASEGFGEVTLILDAAAEAWREPELLVRSKAAVVLPPLPDYGRAEDGAFMALSTAKKLVDAGVPVALSSHGAKADRDRLAMQGALARRGGLSLEEALEAVTITPAKMIGIDDRVGSVEVGKDADLALWNGEPFQATSRVVGTVIDGVLLVDPQQN
ncbi:MAG: amidohydrolase family protein [Planctomycetes bacterium]|nr:amidohydrolase family protein [Planctomycetota bacterium]